MFANLQRMVEFPRIDELMSQYVLFERAYVRNALVKGILLDNQEFLSLVKSKVNAAKEEDL